MVVGPCHNEEEPMGSPFSALYNPRPRHQGEFKRPQEVNQAAYPQRGPRRTQVLQSLPGQSQVGHYSEPAQGKACSKGEPHGDLKRYVYASLMLSLWHVRNALRNRRLPNTISNTRQPSKAESQREARGIIHSRRATTCKPTCLLPLASPGAR